MARLRLTWFKVCSPVSHAHGGPLINVNSLVGFSCVGSLQGHFLVLSIVVMYVSVRYLSKIDKKKRRPA